MAKLKAYGTGLVAHDHAQYPPPPYRGQGWRITLGKQQRETPRIADGKEVIIHASSETKAQSIAHMVYAALCLVAPETLMSDGPIEVFPITSEKKDPRLDKGSSVVGTFQLSQANIPLACMIAAKASFRKKYVYALSKYLLSTETSTRFMIDLHPRHSSKIPVSPFPLAHVRFAYSVVIAYAVIEELGLEIRASAQRPSTINGQWNPVVKTELEQRLVEGKINLSEQIAWHLRGTPTRIERRRGVPSASKLSYSKGQVRDTSIEVVDAIAYASWLRNYVSAHRLRDIVSALSPYDVANVQLLARRLCLETLGYWRYYPKNIRKQQARRMKSPSRFSNEPMNR